MTHEPDLSTLLRETDAGAPRPGDPAMHQRVRTRLLLQDAPPPLARPGPAPRRSSRVRRAAVLVAAAAVGLTVLAVDRPEPAMASLTPEARASAAAATEPAGDTTDARNSCLREFGDGIADDPGASYLLEERRGDLTSMIASYGPQTAFCIVGPDDSGLLDSMTSLPVDVLDRPGAGLTAAVSGGNIDGPLETQLRYVTGRYAPDVQSIDLDLGDGRQLAASLQDGWFTAWWNGAVPSPDARVTWTTTDGTATTVAYADLPY